MDVEDARNLATRLLKKHGFTDWKVRIGRAKRVLGTCDHAKKTITISRAYIEHNSEELIIDTVLHEIAHAMAGPHVQHHGPKWKEIAAQIGATPLRAKTVVPPPRPLSAQCNGCRQVFHRYRRPSGNRCCKECLDRRGKVYVLHWREVLNEVL